MSTTIDYVDYLIRLLKGLFLAVLLIIAVFPVFWIISLSLRPNQETLGRNPTLLPNKWTLENYLNLFGIDVNTDRMQQLDFDALLNFIVNGAIVAVMVTLIACILSLLAGYSFSRFNFPGKKKVFFHVFMLPEASTWGRENVRNFCNIPCCVIKIHGHCTDIVYNL